jgi:hypothetical protein
MNLFIEVQDGQTKNHPATEENLIQAFGFVPSNWEAFVRVERPNPSLYQVFVSDIPTYSKVDGFWVDVWQLRDMTSEEKSAKQQVIIDLFNSREQASNWSAWSIDDATCTMKPPIPRPDLDQTKLDAGIFTFWCGAESNWKDTPIKPTDENQYKFDFFAWQWIQVVN